MKFRIYRGNYYIAPVKFIKHDHEEGYWEEITSEGETPDQWAAYHQPKDAEGETECIGEFWGDEMKKNALLFLDAKAPQPTYWIFGSGLSKAYDNGVGGDAGLEGVFEYLDCRPADGTLYVHEGDEEELIFTYDGWMGYAQISKEEYDKIYEVLNG